MNHRERKREEEEERKGFFSSQKNKEEKGREDLLACEAQLSYAAQLSLAS